MGTPEENGTWITERAKKSDVCTTTERSSCGQPREGDIARGMVGCGKEQGGSAPAKSDVRSTQELCTITAGPMLVNVGRKLVESWSKVGRKMREKSQPWKV